MSRARLALGAVGRFSTPEFTATVRISSQGLREEELPAKAPGERRVLAVGDSFTLAVQVDQDRTFQAELEERLGPSVRVLNAGVDGTGTGQAARYAARLAPVVQPDALLLTFFLGVLKIQPELEVHIEGLPG